MEKRPDEVYAEQKKLASEFAEWSTENPPAGISSESRKNWKVYFSPRYGCFYFEYEKFYDFDDADILINALSGQLKDSQVTWPFPIKYKYGRDNIKNNLRWIALSHYKRDLEILRGSTYIEDEKPHITIEEAVQLGFFRSTAHAMAHLKLLDYVVYRNGEIWIELEDLAYENEKINGKECSHLNITNAR